MVSTITRRAGVAQGTFYNYFNSRQDLFDQLLPSMSDEMLAFIKGRSSHATNDVAREKLRFEAYFAYLLKRPEFYRILYESELLLAGSISEAHRRYRARLPTRTATRHRCRRCTRGRRSRIRSSRLYVDGSSKVSLKPLRAIERLHPGITGFRHEGLHALRLQWLLGRPRQHRESFAREADQEANVGHRSLTAKRESLIDRL